MAVPGLGCSRQDPCWGARSLKEWRMHPSRLRRARPPGSRARRFGTCHTWAYLPHGSLEPRSATRGQAHILCIARWIPNHWTTREVPSLLFLRLGLLSHFRMGITPTSSSSDSHKAPGGREGPVTSGYPELQSCCCFPTLPLPWSTLNHVKHLPVFGNRKWYTVISFLPTDK